MGFTHGIFKAQNLLKLVVNISFTFLPFFGIIGAPIFNNKGFKIFNLCVTIYN